MGVVVEVLIVSSESEPSAGEAVPCCGLEVTKGSAWVVAYVLWEGAGGREGGTHGDSFGDVQGQFLALER